MKAATQAQIAQALGLSQPAVGAVLGQHSSTSHIRLSRETRQRVLDTARRLHYRPHRYAHVVRKGKSGVIGMIQFGGFLQVSLERAIFAAKRIQESGYRLLAGDLLWHRNGLHAACEAMLDAQAEGVLLCNPWRSARELDPLRAAGIPVVAMSGTQFARVPQVRSDVRQGIFDLTQHLLRLGYRRLALLVSRTRREERDTYNWPVRERIDGFRAAVAAAGLSEKEAEVVIEPTPLPHGVPYEAGKIGMERILQRGCLPRAVLCSNDDWAIGALAACARAGVRVPEDVAITGFDNSMAGEYSMVPLTTVSQDPERMADRAVGLLLKRVGGEKLSTGDELVKVPCQLVVRQSCGAAGALKNVGK